MDFTPSASTFPNLEKEGIFQTQFIFLILIKTSTILCLNSKDKFPFIWDLIGTHGKACILSHVDPLLLPLPGLVCQPIVKLSGGSGSAPGQTAGQGLGPGPENPTVCCFC